MGPQQVKVAGEINKAFKKVCRIRVRSLFKVSDPDEWLTGWSG
jgi:hypothetical protein